MVLVRESQTGQWQDLCTAFLQVTNIWDAAWKEQSCLYGGLVSLRLINKEKKYKNF